MRSAACSLPCARSAAASSRSADGRAGASCTASFHDRIAKSFSDGDAAAPFVATARPTARASEVYVVASRGRSFAAAISLRSASLSPPPLPPVPSEHSDRGLERLQHKVLEPWNDEVLGRVTGLHTDGDVKHAAEDGKKSHTLCVFL